MVTVQFYLEKINSLSGSCRIWIAASAHSNTSQICQTHPAQTGQRGQLGRDWCCESRDNLEKKNKRMQNDISEISDMFKSL